jgi:hypothetical protein
MDNSMKVMHEILFLCIGIHEVERVYEDLQLSYR